MIVVGIIIAVIVVGGAFIFLGDSSSNNSGNSSIGTGTGSDSGNGGSGSGSGSGSGGSGSDDGGSGGTGSGNGDSDEFTLEDLNCDSGYVYSFVCLVSDSNCPGAGLSANGRCLQVFDDPRCPSGIGPGIENVDPLPPGNCVLTAQEHIDAVNAANAQ